jgi:hypothetical protein
VTDLFNLRSEAPRSAAVWPPGHRSGRSGRDLPLACRAGSYEACAWPVPAVAEWLYRGTFSKPLRALTQSRYALHAE